MSPERRLERLELLLDELRAAAATAPVLVEGKRDREALEMLGLGGDVMILNVGSSLIDRVTRLTSEHDTIILLMDWDRKGQELFHRLEHLIRAEGGHVEGRFWRGLRPLVQKDIRAVEDLHMLVEQLRKKCKV